MEARRSPRSSKAKPRKLHKIEEYVLKAKVLQADRQARMQHEMLESEGDSQGPLDAPLMGNAESLRPLMLHHMAEGNDVAVRCHEQKARLQASRLCTIYEIQARRSIEEPVNLSLDVRSSTVCFAPQRGIDMGLWAQGGGFQIVSRVGWYHNEHVIGVGKFLQQNFGWQTVEMLSVLLALFLADFFTLLQIQGDLLQDVILSIVFLIFSIELVGLTLTDQMYPFSFSFWMDIIGTFSLITDISFMLGTSATQPYYLPEGHSSGARQVIGIRIARAARLGARAARLSRVLKIMKYLAGFTRDKVTKDDEVKMAKIISNQLNDCLATRVAFYTICIASAIPCFGLFNYPEMDRSMGAWTSTMSLDARSYFHALDSKKSSLIDMAKDEIFSELDRFSKFYADYNYGPFRVCFGDRRHEPYKCHERGDMANGLSTPFSAPLRQSSIWISEGPFAQTYFSMEAPVRWNAAGSMMRVLFVVLTMIVFSMVMNQSVSHIALFPLERMLSVVRERCAQIIRFTSELQDEAKRGNDKEEHVEKEYDEHAIVDNEFVLLEKAISKLAAIANLQEKPEPEVNEVMEEQDILKLNMQGVLVPSGADARKALRASLTLASHSSLNSRYSSHSRTTTNSLGSKWSGNISNDIPEHLTDLMDTWHFDSSELEVQADVGMQVTRSRGRTDEVYQERRDVPVTHGRDKGLVDMPALAAKMMPCWVAAHILISAPGCTEYVCAVVDGETLKTFAAVTESKYKPNPYHNFAHALDVCWSVARFQALCEADRFTSQLTQFWLMIAALGHDIGHEGLSNAYLAETSHPLSLIYNDRSPLENMHCAALFEILADAKSNVFSQLESVVLKEVRKGMIGAILHTDVTKHAEMVKTIAIFYEMNCDVVDAQNDNFYSLLQTSQNNQTICNFLLHCADVGNPMKPWLLCRKLSYKVMDEFFAQGDLEKLHGIPVSMLNDRTKVNIPNSQIGFIEFMIAPMVEPLVILFPGLDALAANLAKNMQNWLDAWNEESTPSTDELEKVMARVFKVRSKMLDLVVAEDDAEEEEEGEEDL